MKEVKAYIKPHKLTAVTLALHKIKGLSGMSVVDVRGLGRSSDKNGQNNQDDALDHVPHVKMEICCSDNQVEEIISVIQKTAHTGLHGDGKIYVSDITTAVRISTGERGENAT